jgi:anaerobic selenocysteine-containing dehydrogenase
MKSNKDYPLMLITVPSLYYFDAAAMDIGLGEFSMLEVKPELVISPEDAEIKDLENGKEVKLATKWGSLLVTVKVKNTVPAGVVSLPLHFTYSILNPAADKVTGSREYGLCAVKLEK